MVLLSTSLEIYFVYSQRSRSQPRHSGLDIYLGKKSPFNNLILLCRNTGPTKQSWLYFTPLHCTRRDFFRTGQKLVLDDRVRKCFIDRFKTADSSLCPSCWKFRPDQADFLTNSARAVT